MAATSFASLPFAAFVVGFVALHLAGSGMSGSMQTLGTDIAPPGARGRFFGVNRLVAEAGSMTNPTSFGIVTVLIAGAGGFAVAFSLMAGAAFLGAGMVAFFLKETLQRDTSEKNDKIA